MRLHLVALQWKDEARYNLKNPEKKLPPTFSFNDFLCFLYFLFLVTLTLVCFQNTEFENFCKVFLISR